MAIVPGTLYSEEQDLIDLVGQDAVRRWSDHEGLKIVNHDRVTIAIGRATSDINNTAGQIYATSGPGSMAESPAVNSWCTWLACYYLSRSRGNPPPDEFTEEKKEIDARLQAITNKEYKLDGVVQRYDSRPTFSNPRIDRRFRGPKVRVVRSTSSTQPSTLPRHFSVDCGDGGPIIQP